MTGRINASNGTSLQLIIQTAVDAMTVFMCMAPTGEWKENHANGFVCLNEITTLEAIDTHDYLVQSGTTTGSLSYEYQTSHNPALSNLNFERCRNMHNYLKTKKGSEDGNSELLFSQVNDAALPFGCSRMLRKTTATSPFAFTA